MYVIFKYKTTPKANMRLYKLNKAVLSFKNKPEKLLNGLTSNELDKPKNAFLDKFGKIIVTANQVKVNDEILMVIEKQFVERLRQHLDAYLKLGKTKLEETDYNAYFDMDGDYNQESDEFTIKQNKGQIILTKKQLKTNITEEEFKTFRLNNNIPIQGRDYDEEMLLNVSEDYVSFKKGCYLGQEIIARVKNKAKPPKRLAVKDNKFTFIPN